MGMLDKAKDLISGNKEQVKGGIDKAADLVDGKTGNQHSDKIDTAAEKAKDAVDKLDPS